MSSFEHPSMEGAAGLEFNSLTEVLGPMNSEIVEDEFLASVFVANVLQRYAFLNITHKNYRKYRHQ